MATVTIAGGELAVLVEGAEPPWTIASRLVLPLAAVAGAASDPAVARAARWLRLAAAQLPGIVSAGAFLIDGERVFWDVRDPEKAIVIRLGTGCYASLVVEVADPAGTVALIERAIAR